MPKQKLSNCCKAEMVVTTTDEGTSFYACSKCHLPCDTYTAKQTKDKLGDSFSKFLEDNGAKIVDRTSEIPEQYLKRVKQVEKEFWQDIKSELLSQQQEKDRQELCKRIEGLPDKSCEYKVKIDEDLTPIEKEKRMFVAGFLQCKKDVLTLIKKKLKL